MAAMNAFKATSTFLLRQATRPKVTAGVFGHRASAASLRKAACVKTVYTSVPKRCSVRAASGVDESSQMMEIAALDDVIDRLLVAKSQQEVRNAAV